MFIRSITVKKEILQQDDSYVREIPAIYNLTALNFPCPVTYFVGENGSGKSTLLEAIAVGFGFNPEGGSKNFNFSTNQTHSVLHAMLTIIKSPYRPKDGFFLRAESFYNTATEIERLDKIAIGGEDPTQRFIKGNYGGKSLHAQSHGESFLALMHNRFWGNGLYLLDEPEAALSPSRQLTMLAEMHRLVKDGSQFIIATHSPILLSYPGACIYSFDGDSLNRVRYEETEHYQITYNFLKNPARMLRILFDESEA